METSRGETPAQNARMASDALAMKPASGIPTWMLHIMDTAYLEARSGHPPGSYARQPDIVYLDFQRAAGVCMIDQYLADNPLTMSAHGYDSGTHRTASTGAEQILLDGIVIDSPEAVAAHLERIVFPKLQSDIAAADANQHLAVARLIAQEREKQSLFGPAILKVPYDGGFQSFPTFRYSDYGYANYFMAYAAYPELIERDFSLQADLAVKRNTLAARAVREDGLPPVIRLDYDMADSRGTLVDLRSLDRIWFPHFARAIAPLLQAGIRPIWHCDGNLMAMVPRLIETGIGGFQGFQYEDGMDYPKIVRMRSRDGGPLMVWAGVSVTRTLPFGTPEEVHRELRFLVENAPPVGFFLGMSSSCVPGVPWENLDTLIEGLTYYRDPSHAKERQFSV
jgi:hypothetical protein